NEIPIVGVDELKHLIERGLNRSIAFHDVVSFVRPVDFSARQIPTQTAGLADSLTLSEESLAILEVRIKAGVLDRNCGLRCQQLQHGNPVRREDTRSQIVLQIKCADKLRLLDDR